MPSNDEDPILAVDTAREIVKRICRARYAFSAARMDGTSDFAQATNICDPATLRELVSETSVVSPVSWDAEDKLLIIRHSRQSCLSCLSDELVIINNTQGHGGIWSRSLVFGNKMFDPWAFDDDRPNESQLLLIEVDKVSVLIWNSGGEKDPIPFHLPAKKLARWITRRCFYGTIDSGSVLELDGKFRAALTLISC